MLLGARLLQRSGPAWFESALCLAILPSCSGQHRLAEGLQNRQAAVQRARRAWRTRP